MVLPPQRRTQKVGTETQRCSKGTTTVASRHHQPQDDRKHHPHQRLCNAMTQTNLPPAVAKEPHQPVVSRKPLPANVPSPNAFHWSLSSSAVVSKHKLANDDFCLNGTQKVLAACQAVEMSAASLHSLVECVRHLPKLTDSAVAERDVPYHSSGSTRKSGGYARPISTSSPVNSTREQYSPNIVNELVSLLEKVQELRMAASEADQELNSLRAENAFLRRQRTASLASRHSADAYSLPTTVSNAGALTSSPQPTSVRQNAPTFTSTCPSASEVVTNAQSPSSCSSTLAKYPHLRTLLLPAASSLLYSVGQEDWPPMSSKESAATVEFLCSDNGSGSTLPVSVQLPTTSAFSTKSSSSSCVTAVAPSSPFYSALQSTDDGLDRLRRHFATIQPSGSSFTDTL